ncbi:MAG: ABC transporter ATP-binding protein [Anaerolineae bacterium]|nr:ABC transporter ATP-binding protein [Anaerolineae bacterium]
MEACVLEKAEFRAQNAYQYNLKAPSWWIASHAWRYKLALVGTLIGKTLSIATYSIAPVFVGQAAEAIINPEKAAPNALLYAALGVLGGLVGDGITNLLGSLSIEVIAQKMEADSREELYASLLGKSQTFHDRQRVGDVMARATEDVKTLNSMINPGFAFIYETVLGFLMPIIYIGILNLQLLLVPLIFVAIYIFTVRRYSRRLDPVTTQQRDAFGKINAGLEETISGIETVKASASENFERRKFHDNAHEYRHWFVRQGQLEAGYIPLLWYGITVGAVFLHSLILYQQETISLAEVIAVMGLMNVLSFPVFVSIWSLSLVQVGLASARRILSMITSRTELDQNVGGHSAPIRGDIAFEGVSYGYGETDYGVYDLSFSVKAGQTVAIVGQTGSGKSTLTQLVNRTYDAGSGRILIDGMDVREWDLNALRSQISKIEQDVFLFSRSIRENIAFGRPDATQEEIEQAAKEAQAHEFILSFDKGYDTEIGERGVMLSGGQRQRLALARAFLSNPRVLILDDSTSAIDSATEDEIQRAIQRAREGRTTLLITHRLSQIRWADMILVMHHGTIVAQGTHDDLLKRSEPYRRIFARYDVALPPLAAGVGGTTSGR